MKIKYDVKKPEVFNLCYDTILGFKDVIHSRHMKLYCHTELVMDHGRVEAIKGKSYFVESYDSRELSYIDESGHNHYIEYSTNKWFYLQMYL